MRPFFAEFEREQESHLIYSEIHFLGILQMPRERDWQSKSVAKLVTIIELALENIFDFRFSA